MRIVIAAIVLALAGCATTSPEPETDYQLAAEKLQVRAYALEAQLKLMQEDLREAKQELTRANFIIHTYETDMDLICDAIKEGP